MRTSQAKGTEVRLSKDTLVVPERLPRLYTSCFGHSKRADHRRVACRWELFGAPIFHLVFGRYNGLTNFLR